MKRIYAERRPPVRKPQRSEQDAPLHVNRSGGGANTDEVEEFLAAIEVVLAQSAA